MTAQVTPSARQKRKAMLDMSAGDPAPNSTRPDWNRLYETAAQQQGHFTISQAADAGYSRQLLQHHIRKGRVARTRRGLYRLTHFPPGDQEDLVIFWLWSQCQGVFSHQTALFLHDLSDALPGRVHMTLPPEVVLRRRSVPAGLRIHPGSVPAPDRTWSGAVPVTRPLRTLRDCLDASVSPELVHQAIGTGLARGLFSPSDIGELTGDGSR